MTEIFESVMLICFGASWPITVYKNIRSRTARSMSLGFIVLIITGYVAGIASKFMNEAYMSAIGEKWYVLFFYVLNLIMVGVDLCLYVRNYRIDKAETK